MKPKPFEFITLKAVRVLGSTHFYNQDGRLKATIPASAKQPKKGSKFITLNCWKFKLDWK